MDQLGIEIKKEASATFPFLASLIVSRALPLTVQFLFQEPTLHAEVNEKQSLLNSLPAGDEELYSKWKKLEAHREFLGLQEVRCVVLLVRGRVMAYSSSTGVYPLRDAQFETRVAPGPRRGQEDQECTAGDRSVPGTD